MTKFRRKLRKLIRNPKMFLLDSKIFKKNALPLKAEKIKSVSNLKHEKKQVEKSKYEQFDLNVLRAKLADRKFEEVEKEISLLWRDYAWFTKLVKAYVLYLESSNEFYKIISFLEQCVNKHNKSKDIRYLHVIYLKKSGNYDCAILNSLYEQLINDYPLDLGIRYALCQHLWETEGVSDSLSVNLAILQKHKDLTANQKQFIAQCLSDAGKYSNALKLYSECRDKVSKKSHILEMLYTSSSMLPMERGGLGFIQELSEFSCQFEKLVQNSSALAIVGNGPTEVGKGRGNIIDSSDLIIRFNNFANGGEFLEDYGSKTHIWVRGGFYIDIHRKNIPDLCGVIISGNNVLYRSLSVDDFLLDNYLSNSNLSFIPPRIYYELISLLKAQPSSGVAMLYWIYKIKGHLHRQWLYGFSLGEQKTNQSEHYFVNSAKPRNGFFQHDWKAEGDLIKSLLRD